MERDPQQEKYNRGTYLLLLCIVLAIVGTMVIKRNLSKVPVKITPQHELTVK